MSTLGPKPSLLDYHGVGASDRLHSYERWKLDTVIWCAEAMQDAAQRIEAVMAEQRLDAMIQMPRRLSKREAEMMRREWTEKHTVRAHSPWWRRWL